MGDEPYLSFDRYAGVYDRTRVASPVVAAALADACVSVGRVDRGGLILDAGVGTGRYAAPLAGRFPGRVVGIDVSWPMLRQVKDKPNGRGVRLIRADLSRIPLPAGSVRVVLAIHVFHLIEDWLGVVHEIRRILAPGGALLVGAEGGGRSVLDDYYLELARQSGRTTPGPGAAGVENALAALRALPGGPKVERLDSAARSFHRRRTARETLDILETRPYSELRTVPDDVHAEIMVRTRNYAAEVFAEGDTVESKETRFTLHALRWG